MTQKPSMRTRLRPVELLVMAAVIAVFVGAIVFMGTREWLTALEFAGIAFVAALVVIAMLLLAVTPQEDRPDADRPDADHPDADHPDPDHPGTDHPDAGRRGH
jgi:hypothetical protein